MVKAVLRLWRWQHMDVDIHRPFFRIREWNISFQVSYPMFFFSLFYHNTDKIVTFLGTKKKTQLIA